MNDKVERFVTTKDRDENITGMVLFPYNEDKIATWFHVNELDELQFVGGSASDLTVPEFNQVMREADGRMQKVESSIDAAVRFLEAKMRDNPEQKKVSEMVWLGFEDAAVWEFCMQDSYRPADEHVELSFSGILLQVDIPCIAFLSARPALPRAVCSAKAASAARADGGRGEAAPACLNPLYLTGGYKSPMASRFTK